MDYIKKRESKSTMQSRSFTHWRILLLSVVVIIIVCVACLGAWVGAGPRRTKASDRKFLTLGFVCKDEDAIIEKFLAHHIAEGVMCVVMMDDRSTDKSVQLAREVCEEAMVDFIQLPRMTTEPVQREFNRTLFELCHGQTIADGWLLVADCDEFTHYRSRRHRKPLARYLEDVPTHVCVIGIEWLHYAPTEQCPENNRLVESSSWRMDLDSTNTLLVSSGIGSDEAREVGYRKWMLRTEACRAGLVKGIAIHRVDCADELLLTFPFEVAGSVEEGLWECPVQTHYSYQREHAYAKKIANGDGEGFRAGAARRTMLDFYDNELASNGKVDRHLASRFREYTAYYINMDHSESRRRHMELMCFRLGLRGARVRPIEYERVPQPAPCDCGFSSGDTHKSLSCSRHSRAWVSLTQTHKAILKEVAGLASSDLCIIFEDDSQLARGLTKFDLHDRLDQLRATTPHNEIWYLGICLQETDECTGSVCSGFCTHAYALTPTGARWLLTTIKCWNHPIDLILRRSLKAPVVGYEIRHAQNSEWRGLFYQARDAPWYTQELPYGLQQKAYEITVVMTTCCRASAPSTHMIRKVFESMELESLLMDRIVLGFDGAEVADENVHEKCKGICNTGHYEQYIMDVKRLASKYFKNVDHVVMPARSCLTTTLRAAMERVETEFVFVAQEDISLAKPFRLEAIMKAMDEDPQLGIVRPAVDTNHKQHGFAERYCQYPSTAPPVKSVNGLELLQVDGYSDQNHISTKSFYRNQVWPRVPDGEFMEHIILCAKRFPGLSGHLWLVGGSLADGEYLTHEDGRNSH